MKTQLQIERVYQKFEKAREILIDASELIADLSNKNKLKPTSIDAINFNKIYNLLLIADDIQRE